MSETAVPPPQARSIRFRIFSLVGLMLVPLIIALVWMAYNGASQKRSYVELQRFGTTGRVSSAIDQQMSIPIGMLLGLAAADELMRDDIASFRAQASKLVPSPTINRIWAFTPAGDVKTTTDASPSAAASYALDDVTLKKVLSGQPAVSPVRGGSAADATVVVAVPVVSKGKVIFGLAAEIQIAPLSRVFRELGLEKNWVAAIVDRNNRFVARSLDAELRIGQLARPELGIAANGANDAGTFQNVTLEGVPMANSFRRSQLTGWTTVVAVPRAELMAPLITAILYSLFASAALVTGTLFLASAMASRISEPIRNLSQFATAIAGGPPAVESTHRIKELDDVHATLERAVAQSAWLAAIVAASGDAIMSIGLDGRILTWNKGAEALFGYEEKEIVGRPKSILVPPQAEAEFQAHRDLVLAGESILSDSVRRHKDGKLIDVSLNSAPIRRPDGRIIAISSILHDIRHRKAEEEHRQFLMREVAHRSKNQLAIIQAIAGQTARKAGSVENFVAAFRQRLQGLAASHDLLVNQDWRNIPLRRLIERQIAALIGIAQENIDVSGPDVDLHPQAAEAIGLAVHELATNSIKYGALSAPKGRVRIVWDVQAQEGASPVLTLQWQERDGPPVEPPTSKGFGTQVIEKLTARAVHGTAEVEYRAGGLHWRLAFPLKQNYGTEASA